MKTTTPRKHQYWQRAALRHIEPWLDASFPAAATLLCLNQRIEAYSLLASLLLIRLLLKSEQQAWRWTLISLLVISGGLIIQDLDLKPGSPSDYLIIALGFAAGLNRTHDQWKRSFAWMSSSVIPLLSFSVLAGDQMIQLNSSFMGFNINKVGFLSGLLSVLAYGLLQRCQRPMARTGALILLTAAITEALLTESRSAIAAPIIAVFIELIAKARWTLTRALIATAIALASSGIVLLAWYGNFELNGNTLSDLNRLETVRCWINTTLTTPNGLSLGLGFKETAQSSCGPDEIPTLLQMEKTAGLGHAHNLYAQFFSETGIPGLALIVGLTISAFHRAWQQRSSKYQEGALALVSYLFLMALGLTYWQVMMLNQVLVGYTLASLTAVEPDPGTATATTPATLQSEDA